MPERIVRALLRGFSAPAVRYPPDPRAMFILMLCVVSGIPLIFANATPGSIASKLDTTWVITWGVMLSGGSLLAVIGSLRQTATGVILEQIGSVALGVACVIYASAIWFTVELRGAVPIGIVLGFGIASLWRWYQLQRYLNTVERIAREFREGDE